MDLKKTLVFLFLISTSLMADIDAELKAHFSFASSKTDVEQKLLMAIGKTESSFNKYSIGIVAHSPAMLKKFFELNNVKFFQSKDKTGRMFSLIINDKTKAEEYFYKFKYFVKKYPNAIKTYDLGLMQINISNIKGGEEKEKMYLLNTKINSLFGAVLLQDCYNKFKDVKYAIECYNKGTNSNKFGSFEYYKKVSSNYASLKI